MRTYFWNIIIMNIFADFSFISFYFSFWIFHIVYWFTIKSFFNDYIFLAIHHLLSKKIYLVSLKLFAYPLTFGSAIYNNLTFSFNRDLNRGFLAYMFSLRFSGSKFLINSRRQFHVRKICSCSQNISYASFCGICSHLILHLKLLFRKCITYVLGCSFIKTCSLTGC